MLDIADPRTIGDIVGPPRDRSHRDELIDIFIASTRTETTAVLTAMSELLGRPLGDRIRAELATRDDELPVWLSGLAPLTIEGVFETEYVLGDGNHVLIGAQTASGHPFTCMVYIDHNFGTVAKDGAAIWEPIEAVAGALRAGFAKDSDCDVRALDPAVARARITEAIEAAAGFFPPLTTDTWPSARPVVEWVVRHLPAGCTAATRTEWDQRSREGLMDAFLASAHGKAFDAEARDALGHLLVFTCDDGAGDPLRWSPARVAVLLTRWLPQRLMPDCASFRLLPDVLRAWVRYSHARQAIRPDLTDDTLAMIDDCEADFRHAVVHNSAPGFREVD